MFFSCHVLGTIYDRNEIIWVSFYFSRGSLLYGSWETLLEHWIYCRLRGIVIIV